MSVVRIALGSNDDSIFNAESNVRIDAGEGNDFIENSGKNVTINGGEGIDTLIGQDSIAETFIHTAGTDIIYGFGSGDSISVTVTDSVQNGSDVLLTTSNGSIVLKNTNLNRLVVEDNQIVYGYSQLPSIQISDSIYAQGNVATISSSEGQSIVGLTSNGSIIGGDGDNLISNDLNKYYYYTYHNDGSRYIFSGIGNDSIYNSYAYSTVDASDGSDLIYNNGDFSSIAGGLGDDEILNHSRQATINAGDGNDTIRNYGECAILNGGAGNDSIYNVYAYSTLNGGTGIDTIIGQGSIAETFIHSTDTDIIYGFYLGDTVSIDSGEITSSVQSGSDVLISTSNGSVVLKNTDIDNVSVDGNLLTFDDSNLPRGTSVGYDSYWTNRMTNYTAFGTIFPDGLYGGGADNAEYITNYGWYVTIGAGAGSDTITNYGWYSSISGGTYRYDDRITNDGYYTRVYGRYGSNVIENYGDYSTIYGEEGNDTIRNSGWYSYIIGGMQNDSIYNTGAYTTIFAGYNDSRNEDDDDRIENFEGDNVLILGDNRGRDYIKNTGGLNVTINTGEAGHKTIESDQSVAELMIVSGDYDYIYGFGSGDTVSVTGEITSSVQSGSDVVIYNANGSFYLKNTNIENVEINDGNFLTFKASSVESDNYNYIDVSGGNDSIYIERSVATILTADGSQIVSLNENDVLNVGAGADFVSITRYIEPPESFFASDGDDTIYVDGSIATIQTSSQTSTISIVENDTIDTGAGHDIVSIMSGNTLYIVANSGDDTIRTNSGEFITLSGGDGQDSVYHGYDSHASINLGAGDDYIYHWWSDYT